MAALSEAYSPGVAQLFGIRARIVLSILHNVRQASKNYWYACHICNVSPSLASPDLLDSWSSVSLSHLPRLRPLAQWFDKLESIRTLAIS